MVQSGEETAVSPAPSSQVAYQFRKKLLETFGETVDCRPAAAQGLNALWGGREGARGLIDARCGAWRAP